MNAVVARTPGPPEYIVAVTSPPPIACPAWCAVPYEEHVAELPDWEGLVIHWSEDVVAGGGDFRLARTAFADGTPSPDEPSLNVHVGRVPDCQTAAEAAAFAAAMLATIEKAQS